MAIVDGSGRYLRTLLFENNHIYLYTPFNYHSNSTSTLEEELANWVTFIDVQTKINNNNNNNNIMAPTTKTAYVTGQYRTLLYTWGVSMDISRDDFFESIVEKKKQEKTTTKSITTS